MYTNETTMMNPAAAATDPTLAFVLPDMAGSDTGEFSREELAEDMEGITVYFTRAKIPGGGVTQFELPTDDESTPEYVPKLVGVILHSHDQCALWEENSDDEDNKPLCSSVDGKVGIGTPGGTCATCAMNVYGTAVKGAGKACKNSRVLYLLRSGDYLPLQLNLPPTSIGAFKEFYRKAFALRQRPAYASLVEISLKKETNGKEEYSVAVFRRIADFSGEKLQQVRSYANTFKEQIKVILEQRAQSNVEQYVDPCEIVGENAMPLGKDASLALPSTIDGERNELPG